MPNQSDAIDGAKTKAKGGSEFDRIVDGSLCGPDPISSAMPPGEMRVPGGAQITPPLGGSTPAPDANLITPPTRRGQDRVTGGSAT